MALEPGKVVYCTIPHTDGQGADDRPVMVLAMAFAEDFIGCIITSQTSNFEHRIPITNKDLEGGTLESDPSYVRFRRLLTLEPAAIRRPIGQAKPEFVNRVMAALRKTFADV